MVSLVSIRIAISWSSTEDFQKNVFEIFRGRLSLSNLECSCSYGVKNGHIAAGWVGECGGELDAPVVIL